MERAGANLNVRHRLGSPLPNRVLILRALQLGDLLCSVPAFRALRAALPHAEIVLVGLPWAGEFVKRFSCYLDGFREFPGYPGLPERSPLIDRMPAFLSDIQQEKFDLAIQMHGSGPFVNSLTVLFGARHSAGFHLPSDYCPDAERYLPWPEQGLEIRRMLQLMEFLGIEPLGEDLNFPITREDHHALRMIPGVHDLIPKTYVCMHPGASVPERRWPIERFSQVAQAFADQGFPVVLTGTTKEETLTREITNRAKGRFLNLAGQTDLGTLGAVLQKARLLVCNDTGVSHLATAVGVPSVIISTGDQPARWAPPRGPHRVLCRDAGVNCEEVMSQAKELLNFG
jgi:ADP-heptose:LPS heptosyltransferase